MLTVFFILNFDQFWTTYPGVHEYKVHLHKGEDHLQEGIDSDQDVVARRVEGDLEEGAKLQSNVDHGTKTEGCGGSETIVSRYEAVYPLLPMAPTRRKKLPWVGSLWVVFLFRTFFGVTATSASTGASCFLFYFILIVDIGI